MSDNNGLEKQKIKMLEAEVSLLKELAKHDKYEIQKHKTTLSHYEYMIYFLVIALSVTYMVVFP